MAASTKPIYSLVHSSLGGRIVKPGEQFPEDTAQPILESLLAHGEATENEGLAKKAATDEGLRQERVEYEQSTRSVKRDHDKNS